MKVLAIRFYSISDQAESLARFFDGLGLTRKEHEHGDADSGFSGAIFPAGDSWIEVWNSGPEMASETILQVVVDDADAFAKHASDNGLSPQGPVDAHGERIFFVQAPGGLQVSFQSKLE